MTLQEAKNSVKEVVESAKDYQSSIKDLQRKIIDFADDVTTAFNSVGNEIGENSIVEYSNKNATQLISILSDMLDLSNSTLNSLSLDANKRIREIVDEYNASLPQDSKEPKLSYYEVALAGIGGSISSYKPVVNSGSTLSNAETIEEVSKDDDNEETSDEESSTRTSRSRSYSGGGSYGGSYYGGTSSLLYGDSDDTMNKNKKKKKNKKSDLEEEEPRSETDEEVNQYIEMFETEDGIKSEDIYGWEDLMKKLLEEHGLDTYIDKLELEEKFVKCSLVNSKKYKISNISTVEELLRSLDKIVEMEDLK